METLECLQYVKQPANWALNFKRVKEYKSYIVAHRQSLTETVLDRIIYQLNFYANHLGKKECLAHCAKIRNSVSVGPAV